MIPAEQRVTQVMDDTGMGRLQAIRHLQQRDELLRRVPDRRFMGGRNER